MAQHVTTKQMAKILGVHERTIYRMRNANQLPPKLNLKLKIVRWLKSDVDLWLELGCPSEAQFKKLKRAKAQLT